MTAQLAVEEPANWTKPTKRGKKITFSEVVDEIIDYTREKTVDGEPVTYNIYIGTDSQRHGETHSLSTAISVTRTRVGGSGKGGIYFHSTERVRHINSLRQKMSTEAVKTHMTFFTLKSELESRGVDIPIELHFDVSKNGASRIALADVTGMAMGAGCPFKIKPEAWCASGVANRHTK